MQKFSRAHVMCLRWNQTCCPHIDEPRVDAKSTTPTSDSRRFSSSWIHWIYYSNLRPNRTCSTHILHNYKSTTGLCVCVAVPICCLRTSWKLNWIPSPSVHMTRGKSARDWYIYANFPETIQSIAGQRNCTHTLSHAHDTYICWCIQRPAHAPHNDHINVTFIYLLKWRKWMKYARERLPKTAFNWRQNKIIDAAAVVVHIW